MRVPTPGEAVLVMTRMSEIAKDLEPLYQVTVGGVVINGVYKGGMYESKNPAEEVRKKK